MSVALDVLEEMIAEVDSRPRQTREALTGGGRQAFDGEALGKWIRKQILLEVRDRIREVEQ